MKRTAAVLVLVLLTAALTYALTRPEPPLPLPPTVADTVFVDVITADTIWRERVRTVVRDQPNQADTVWQTAVDTVRVTDTLNIAPSWYLTLAEGPEVRGDSARYLLELFGVSTGSLVRQTRQERHPFPAGPIVALYTDSLGLRVRYGEWPVSRPLFDFGDVFSVGNTLETVAVCGGTAALAKSVEAGFFCAGIKTLFGLLP